jgi:MFS family permease
LLLGLASAGTQAGAIVGSLACGWLMDRLGRRVMFLATMVLFIFPLIGLLAATIVLPEVYGFVEVRRGRQHATARRQMNNMGGMQAA